MAKANKSRNNLVVTEEAIQDFVRMSVSQRIQWLDETRAFLIRTLSPQAQKRWGWTRKAA